MIRAQVISQALIEFPPGVLTETTTRAKLEIWNLSEFSGSCSIAYLSTVTPFLVAASKSMLSTPVPALPMTFNPGELLITSFVTLVSDLTISPSCSYIGNKILVNANWHPGPPYSEQLSHGTWSSLISSSLGSLNLQTTSIPWPLSRSTQRGSTASLTNTLRIFTAIFNKASLVVWYVLKRQW